MPASTSPKGKGHGLLRSRHPQPEAAAHQNDGSSFFVSTRGKRFANAGQNLHTAATCVLILALLHLDRAHYGSEQYQVCGEGKASAVNGKAGPKPLQHTQRSGKRLILNQT